MKHAWLSRVRELSCALSLFLPCGRFAYTFARGKLGGDPIFRALLQAPWLPEGGEFLGLGCGQGCWFACLIAARQIGAPGSTSPAAVGAPKPLHLRGVEWTPSDVQRARLASASQSTWVQNEQGDMCRADLGRPDLITVLDALHYVDHERQQAQPMSEGQPFASVMLVCRPTARPIT